MSPTQDTNQLIACLVLAILRRTVSWLGSFSATVSGHLLPTAIKDEGKPMVVKLASVLNRYPQNFRVNRHALPGVFRLLTYVRRWLTIDRQVDLETVPIQPAHIGHPPRFDNNTTCGI